MLLDCGNCSSFFTSPIRESQHSEYHHGWKTLLATAFKMSVITDSMDDSEANFIDCFKPGRPHEKGNSLLENKTKYPNDGEGPVDFPLMRTN